MFAAHFAAMAALTIQDVIRYPLVSQTINEMNELIPGVPVTKENLQTLFDNYENVFMGHRHGDRGMRVRSFRDKKLICVEIDAPVTDSVVNAPVTGPRNLVLGLARKEFPNTPDGFFQALMWTKDILKRYREDGPCPDCVRDERTDRQPPRKKMKLANMPKCGACMYKAIVHFGDGSK